MLSMQKNCLDLVFNNLETVETGRGKKKKTITGKKNNEKKKKKDAFSAGKCTQTFNSPHLLSESQTNLMSNRL